MKKTIEEAKLRAAAQDVQAAWLEQMEKTTAGDEAEPSEEARQRIWAAMQTETKQRRIGGRIISRVAVAAAVVLGLLVAFNKQVQAEVQSWFSVSNRIEENGLIYKIGLDYNLGPEDFYILSDDELLFLNSADSSVLLYKDGELAQQYNMITRKAPCVMAVRDRTVYIPDKDAVIVLNLDTGKQERVALPDEISLFGLEVYDLVWDEQQLVIVTRQGVNYALNLETDKFVKTEAGYTIRYENNFIEIRKGTGSWKIREEAKTVRPIGFESNGNIIITVLNSGLDKKDERYCMVCRYSQDGTCLDSSSIAAGKWGHQPCCFAHWDTNDTITVLSPYVNSVKLSNIELGKDDLSDENELEYLPDTNVPRETIPNPTGFGDGEVQIACLFYNGTVWTEFLSGLPVLESLPEGEYKLAGNIRKEVNTCLPSEDLVSAHFKTGLAVYVSGDGSKMYVRMGESRYVGLIPYEELLAHLNRE